MILSEEFWSSESRWQLIKSPIHLAVGACRQLENTEPPLAGISSWLAATGQTLFQTPDFGDSGWPGHEDWVTPSERLAVRYQLASVLMGQMPQLGISRSNAAPNPARQSRRILGTRLQGATARALLERLDPAPGMEISEIEKRVAGMDPETRVNETIKHVLATRQYQLA
jgi:uncharacterized protein (DUF1800 family)